MRKTIVLKPTLACNLRCKYCYEFRRDVLPQVGNDTLELSEVKNIIQKFAKLFKNSQILWMLHGGEPLLGGAKFLKEILEFLRDINEKYSVNFKFALQTNATLLNDEVIKILENNIDLLSERVVSVSIDGPKHIHDSVRLSKSGGGASFDSVMKALQRIQNSKLSYTTISVIARHNVDKIDEIYEFIKSLRPNFAKFIPCYNFDKFANAENFGIYPLEYANAMVQMFNLYSRDTKHFKHDKLAIDPLISIISNILDKKVSWCEYAKTKCDNFTTIFPNGELWLCDSFKHERARDEAYVGNIFELSDEDIISVFKTPNKHCSYKNFEREILKDCNYCSVKKYCFGGCMAHRQDFKNTKLELEHCEAKRLLINYIKKVVEFALP